MKWLLGPTAILVVIFGAWFFSIEHLDPVALAVERKLGPAVAACSDVQTEFTTIVEDDSNPAQPPQPEPVASCWQAINSVLADVTLLLRSKRERAAKQLANWGWTPTASKLTAHLPDPGDEKLQRTFFDRSLGPRREWWDPRPAAYGCMRYYQVVLVTAADDEVVKAYAYQADPGFTVCS